MRILQAFRQLISWTDDVNINLAKITSQHISQDAEWKLDEWSLCVETFITRL